MKQGKYSYSRGLITGTTATLAVLSGGQSSHALQLGVPPIPGIRHPASSGLFAFHREGLLGTSFELLVGAVREMDARVCEQQVLAEIERLRLILSTYDAQSEINRIRADAAEPSTELAELLSAYKQWTQRTGGAINVNMAEVIGIWKQARTALPALADLEAAFARPRAFNVDALGKGYIIDRAVEVARRFAPSGLLNIGGDIRVWGDVPWQIGIANPFAPAENAPLLGCFSLRDGAVATSGGYSRFVDVDGRRYSHIIDPRTLRPVSQIVSASIVAANCMTANAISTAANVLGLVEGVRLAKSFGAWEHLLVDIQGRMECSLISIATAAEAPAMQASGDETSVEASAPATPAPSVAPSAETAWPTNFQVKINFRLKAPPEGRAKRPYVAVWVEDSNKKLVRTVSVWGSDWKWLQELSGWWKAGSSYTDTFAQSITRATRAPGNYLLTWDGLNDKKQPVPQGEYKIFMEINREHGRHVSESLTIKCGTEVQSAEFRATPESDVSKVEYSSKSQ